MTTQLKSEVYDILLALAATDVPFDVAKMIVAQAMHESNNFTSNVYKSNNNAFGMKMPSKRVSPYIVAAGTSAPSNEGSGNYAKYKSVSDSALDAVHLYKYNKIDFSLIKSISDFVLWLKSKSYFGDTVANYTAGVQRYYSMLDGVLLPVVVTPSKKGKVVGIVAGILLILALLFMMTKK